jgi:hypothetical protein
MATFPTLKTGAVAQYPLKKTVRFSTQAVRFLDGSQQKYRLNGAGLRNWTIALSQLDEQELNALINFAEQQQGGAFTFVDPLTGFSVHKCMISGDSLEALLKRDSWGAAMVVVEELP